MNTPCKHMNVVTYKYSYSTVHIIIGYEYFKCLFTWNSGNLGNA